MVRREVGYNNVNSACAYRQPRENGCFTSQPKHVHIFNVTDGAACGSKNKAVETNLLLGTQAVVCPGVQISSAPSPARNRKWTRCFSRDKTSYCKIKQDSGESCCWPGRPAGRSSGSTSGELKRSSITMEHQPHHAWKHVKITSDRAKRLKRSAYKS